MCRCDDNVEYVVKDTIGDPQRPHNEWFCTRLAGAVGIVCPPCCPIEDEAGQLLFGSRCEGGVAGTPWLDMVVRGEIDKATISSVLSRILAFDHFVHNDDRHLGNYLVRATKNGWVMLAMDFSRAWSFHGFPPAALPFTAMQKTWIGHQKLKRELGDFVDISEVNVVLDALLSVKTSDIGNILDQQPNNWLTRSRKNDIVAWWKSAERPRRIEAIRKGIGDGSYL